MQLMRVIDHYFSKIASACLLLVLCGRPLCCPMKRFNIDQRIHRGWCRPLQGLNWNAVLLVGRVIRRFYWELQPTWLVWEILGICPWIICQECINWYHLSLSEIFAIPLILFDLRSVDKDPESFTVAESLSENRGAVCEAPLKTVLHNVNTITHIKLKRLQVNLRATGQSFFPPWSEGFYERVGARGQEKTD